jgi:hypothetical protein
MTIRTCAFGSDADFRRVNSRFTEWRRNNSKPDLGAMGTALTFKRLQAARWFFSQTAKVREIWHLAM